MNERVRHTAHRRYRAAFSMAFAAGMLPAQLENQAHSQNVPMTNPAGVLAVHEQRYGHSVSFVELAAGRVLESGGREFRVSTDGGVHWSEPYTGMDERRKPVDARSLVRLTGSGIGLVTVSYDGGIHQPVLLFRRSEDEGRTWSGSALISSGMSINSLQDVLLRTSSGRIILPVYVTIGQDGDFSWHQEGAPFVGGFLHGVFIPIDAHFYDPHFGASYVFYSDDDGRTWRRNRDGELFIIIEPGGQMEATFEPSVTEVQPGNLLMVMRTRVGRYFQAWSHDDGETWTRPQPTQLAGTHSPAQVRTLKGSGHLLCVFTQQSEEEVRKGFVRTRLSTAISRNRGGVWEHFQNLEAISEETHVEPGPIRIVRPAGGYSMRETAAFQNDPADIVPFQDGYGIWDYPSVMVLTDRVLISYPYSWFDKTGTRMNAGGNRLKVLPLRWLYGGHEPFDNPILKKIGEAPKP